MVKTGEYLVQFYNKAGTKLRDKTEIACCVTEARDIGDDIVFGDTVLEPVDPVKSFTVYLAVFNSLDKE